MRMRRLRLKPTSPAGVPILVSLAGVCSLSLSLSRSLSLFSCYYMCIFGVVARGAIRINVYSVWGSGGGSIKALFRIH
jgi:hypothetical protein